MTTNDAILIVGPAWVGDMMMAQSLLILLKEKNPDTAIDVLAPQWSLGVLARMPEVRGRIALDIKHNQLGLLKRFRCGKFLRSKSYKQAYVLPRTIKSALVPYFAKIPIRTGILGELRYGLINDIRPLDKSVLDQTVKKYTSFVQASVLLVRTPFPRLKPDQVNQQRLIDLYQIDRNRLIVGLVPGAEFGPAKQWPLAHYTRLAGMVNDIGGRVILFGSGKDRLDGEQISQSSSNVLNLCGETTLGDAVDLLSVVDIAVANDSGLMHVAASVGIPLVGLYGSTNPGLTPPLTDKGHVEWLNLECAPCGQRQCPLQHLNCLNQISPERIFKHIELVDKQR